MSVTDEWPDLTHMLRGQIIEYIEFWGVADLADLGDLPAISLCLESQQT